MVFYHNVNQYVNDFTSNLSIIPYHCKYDAILEGMD